MEGEKLQYVSTVKLDFYDLFLVMSLVAVEINTGLRFSGGMFDIHYLCGINVVYAASGGLYALLVLNDSRHTSTS
jgi:hypothetical protein